MAKKNYTINFEEETLKKLKARAKKYSIPLATFIKFKLIDEINLEDSE